MAHSAEKLLADVCTAGQAILSFTAGCSRADYDGNLMLRSAVERQFEIRGEALRPLELVDPDLALQITDSKRIIAFRNLIAHGYDAIDSDIVWQVVTEKLPILNADAQRLLRNQTV